MKASRGEIKIAEILTNNNLHYQEEYSFADLVTASKRPLRFDFAIFDDNKDLDFLIEFQGIQHYQAKSRFGGSKGFSKQRYNDTRKRVYCYQHNITLIAIPYWQEAEINYDFIMKLAGY